MTDPLAAWLDEMERKARAATPGPWAYEPTGLQDNGWCLGQVTDDDDNLISGRLEPGQGEVVELVCENGSASGFADAAYIAALPPETVSALLECVRALEYWQKSTPTDMAGNFDPYNQPQAVAGEVALARLRKLAKGRRG